MYHLTFQLTGTIPTSTKNTTNCTQCTSVSSQFSKHTV